MKIPIWIKSEYVTYIGISTFHSGRCWTSATGTQHLSDYIEILLSGNLMKEGFLYEWFRTAFPYYDDIKYYRNDIDCIYKSNKKVTAHSLQN